jgi:hypothetical protein
MIFLDWYCTVEHCAHVLLRAPTKVAGLSNGRKKSLSKGPLSLDHIANEVRLIKVLEGINR